MAPDNYFIADQFSLLAKLMDIHGENSFKSKSYSAAAFNIEKLPMPLHTVAPEKLASLKGIGDSAAKKITEILQTGQLKALNDLLAKTPEGILQMMQIKGLGPKKIASIWKEMDIESIGELLYACNETASCASRDLAKKPRPTLRSPSNSFLSTRAVTCLPKWKALPGKYSKASKSNFPVTGLPPPAPFAGNCR